MSEKALVRWDYAESVKKMRPLIIKWRNMTVEMLEELWVAKDNIKAQGSRTDLTSGKIARSWGGYCEAIGFPIRTADHWLSRYDHENHCLLEAPQKKNRINEDIDFPEGKYSVIYADPPWQYNNSGFEESAQSHYPTMSIEQLCDLPVKELSTKDTILFLWITNPILPEAFKVIDSWGFEYKTNFVWNKNKGPSIGWFNTARHELLLIATQKNNRHPQEKYESCIFADVTEHSKKPEIVYDMIENMYSGPYIELFARRVRVNWEAWGNQIEDTSN